jgi:xanthine dehydrogenase accessory factor
MIIGSDDPLTLRRGNAFSQAAFSGGYEVEGVAVSKAVVTEAASMIERNVLPLLTATCRSVVDVLNPDIIVQARCPSSQGEISVGDASLVIGIGCGFDAGNDCDQVIHAAPGHDMGRIVFRGTTEGFAGTEQEDSRLLVKTTAAGRYQSLAKLGAPVGKGETIAQVGDHEIKSPADGVVSAHLLDGVETPAGRVVAEVDVTGSEESCYTISGLGRAVSGSVLESVAAWIADMGAFSRD